MRGGTRSPARRIGLVGRSRSDAVPKAGSRKTAAQRSRTQKQAKHEAHAASSPVDWADEHSTVSLTFRNARSCSSIHSRPFLPAFSRPKLDRIWSHDHISLKRPALSRVSDYVHSAWSLSLVRGIHWIYPPRRPPLEKVGVVRAPATKSRTFPRRKRQNR